VTVRCYGSGDVDFRISPLADAASRVEAESVPRPAIPRWGRIKLWSPEPDEITREVCSGAAACLSAAFSSGVWSETPMPVGDETDPDSAAGIIAGLAERLQLLLALFESEDTHNNSQEILGSVVGTLLREPILDTYGLRRYGAHPGDALLAYIGLVPAAQRSRVHVASDSLIKAASHSSDSIDGGCVRSLASLMFTRWMELPAIRSASCVFIRTRIVIGSIQHLAAKHDFQLCGSFDINFRGQKQDRMVFRRRTV
jgi:hypothetical protein